MKNMKIKKIIKKISVIFCVILFILPYPTEAYTVFITSGSTWTVPADWSDNNKIEVIGGGGGGYSGTNGAPGGGGGAYAMITNLTGLIPGNSVNIQIDTSISAGQTSDDTFFNRHTGTATTCTVNEMSVCAKGGATPANSPTPGAGGSGTNSIGDVKSNGGNGGGSTTADPAGGGGGAGGPCGTGVGGVGGNGH